jgi:hypothetical protein
MRASIPPSCSSREAAISAISLSSAAISRGGVEVGLHASLADRGHERTELGVAPAELAGARLVGVHAGVGQLVLELGVLGERVVGRGAVSRHLLSW